VRVSTICTKTVKPGDDLRAAILSLPEGGTLCFEPGVYEAPIRVEQSATLRAKSPGAGEVVLDAGGRGAVFATSALDATIVLEDLVLQNGRAAEAGGGVAVEGAPHLVLRRCTLRDNRGGSYGGAGLWANDGTLVMESCRVTGNDAERGGAGLLLDGTARARVVGTLIAGNRARRGSVVWVRDGAQLALLGCTVAGNEAGGAILGDGTTTRSPDVTIAGCIIAHAEGPLVVGDKQAPRPTFHIEETVLHGKQPLLDASAGNVVGDPLLADDYVPAEGSPARDLWTEPRGHDLLGRERPTPATAGALE
jgi:hypothetical protein